MYEEIKEQFEEVIAYSQDIDRLNVDTLFNKWIEAKRDIIEAFDGKLIYEVAEPIHFHLDPIDRTRYFDDFIYRIASIYENQGLANFLCQNKDSFFDNIVNIPYEQNDIKIPKGMKLVKAFKYFEKDQALLEQLQNQASQVIQEDKIEGKLCFSVHPLDFLTTSVNTYNWRSCHSLDGEYRSGNLSYMIDKTTIVCYLKGADNVELPMFPHGVSWNSKKWRVLLYLANDWSMIFAGRQYPFASMSGLNIAYEHLLKALKLHPASYSGWRNDYVSKIPLKNGDMYGLNTQYLPMRGQLYDFTDIVEDHPHSLQFNDLLRSSTYHEPFYALKDNYFWWSSPEELPKVIVGEEVPCLCCGQERIRDGDMMVCRHCADRYGYYTDGDVITCDCCGGRIYDENNWYDVEGETLCPNCYANECFICECCGEAYFNEDKRYDREHDRYLCVHCYNDD